MKTNISQCIFFQLWHILKLSKSAILILMLHFLFFPNPIIAQDEPDWKHEFNKPIHWSYFDEQTSLYYLYSEPTYFAFDCIEKKIVWELDIPGLKNENTTRIPDFPYSWLKGLPSEKTNKGKKVKLDIQNKQVGGRWLLINYLTGEILADTDHYEIETIKEYYVIGDAGLVFLKGKQEKERVFAAAEFNKKGLSWLIPSPEPLKKITIFDEIYKKPIANDGHIVFGYARSLIGLDRATGEVLWKRPLKVEPKVRLVLQRPYFARLTDPNFYLSEHQAGSATLKAYSMKDGQPAWEAPFVLGGGRYWVFVQKNQLHTRTEKSFNYVAYDSGKGTLDFAGDLPEHLVKVHKYKGDYLLLLARNKSTAHPPLHMDSRNEENSIWNLRMLKQDLSNSWKGGC